MATMAGTGTRNRSRKTTTRFRGNSTMYAPRTAAIAPEAPRLGTIEFGSTNIWAKLAMMPATR